MGKLRLMSIRLPPALVEQLDEMIKLGRYPSRSEAIRHAVLLLIERERGLMRMSERRVYA